jgi:glyceraldehyde 3-phosphate dehydrogenase
MEVMDRHFGVEKAILTTIHAYTATQAIVDQPSGKDWLRGRAAAINIVPATTGAAVATAKALPQLKGKFDGIAARVPVPDGSLSDITILTKKKTTADEVNRVLREEAASERYRGIMGVSDVPLVSSDVIGDDRASVMDLTLTTVVDGNLVKVLAWYDNEWGYTSQMVREAVRLVKTK